MLLTIGELARKAEVNPSAIRYYESIGLLPEPTRINGQRRYSPDATEKLRFIKTAQITGFSIQEIAVLMEGFDAAAPSASWTKMANQKYAELLEKKKQIEAMLDILQSGLDCNCMTWSECYSKISADVKRRGKPECG